jgi:Uma2 family endonuclease
MTTTTEPHVIRQESTPIILKGIAWETYESLREELDRSGQHLYLTYDRGALEIMAPSPFHERYKGLIGRFLEIMSLELNIPIASFGSTTFKREDIERGLEPDECFYVQHEPVMGAKFEIDLLKDPPPDLAVEIDYSPHAIDRESIYAALGVPEIWQYDGERLAGLTRGEDASYRPIESSVAFPFLRLADIERFLRESRGVSQNTIVHAFRDWVRKTFTPRGSS